MIVTVVTSDCGNGSAPNPTPSSYRRQTCSEVLYHGQMQLPGVCAGQTPPHTSPLLHACLCWDLRQVRPFAAAQRRQRRRCSPVSAAADGDKEQSGGKGLFSFVTDNPRSQSVSASFLMRGSMTKSYPDSILELEFIRAAVSLRL